MFIDHSEYSSNMGNTYVLSLFSSPEPKAQVSFSDQNLSVVRHRRRRCCCQKLFTFSSSPGPPYQFQPNKASLGEGD